MAGKTEAAVLLGAWLESIGLAKHLEAVLAEWGEDVEAVRQATVDDWERVGVTLLTHRRRLVKAASSLPSLHQSTESPLKKQKAHSSSSSSSSSSSFLLSGSNDDDETLVTDLHLPPASVITSIAFPPAGSLVAPMPPQKGEDPLGLWELFEGGAEEWYGQLKGVLARGAAAEFLGPGRSRWVVPGRPFVFQALKARAPGEWSVVVFGQNPYPRMESATGIAMLDNTFSTWADPRFGKVVSMRTIAKAALRWRDPSVPVSTTVADLRARFKRSSVVEPPQWFAAMLSQGVLLLNAALTTTSTDAPSSSDAPTPSAHDKFWQPVVAEILRTIFHHRAATGSGLVFSWWGTKALSLRKKYVDGLALQYPQVPVVHLQHSNPAAQGDTFSNQGSVFQDINDALQQLRLPQVDWLPTKDWFTAHTQQSSASLRMHDFITSTRELHLQFLERLADLKSDVGLSQMLPVADIFTAIPAPKSLRDAVSSVAPKTALEVALKFALRLSPHSMASTNLSPDEIASIHLYTSGSVFYKKLNETLRNPIRAKLLPYYPYLQIFLSSLRKLRADPAKLPSKPLWRGINADLRSAFKLHSTVVWWGVSSCSMDPTVADGFSSGSSMAMVFEIHAQRAVAIASHSAFPTEQEYLLPPGSQLSVTEIRQPQKNRCHVILHELDDEFLIA